MAEEKVTNEEVLDEEQLEEVAGGARWEIQDDVAKLKKYGYFGEYDVPTRKQINDAIIAIAAKAGYKVGYNPDNDAANRYYFDHHAKSHEYFWNKIRSKLGDR